MKQFIVIAAAVTSVFVLSLAATAVHAQSYPNHSIQMIIPIPAGGGGDVNGRILADEMGKLLGQQIIVTNKPGASDTLGTDALAKSKKDGYTLGYTDWAALVYSRISLPALPMTGKHGEAFVSSTLAFWVSAGLHRGRPLGELAEYAKKNPTKLRVEYSRRGKCVEFQCADYTVPYRRRVHPCPLQRR